MRKPRINIPNAIYHIYNQGVNREDIYKDREDVKPKHIMEKVKTKSHHQDILDWLQKQGM